MSTECVVFKFLFGRGTLQLFSPLLGVCLRKNVTFLFTVYYDRPYAKYPS